MIRPAPSSAVLALAASLLFGLAACGGGAPDNVGVRGLELRQRGAGYPTVSGYVVNGGGAEARSVDVSITLYDADNRPIEDVLLQVQRVAPGDSLRFERELDLLASSAKVKYVGVN